jgi:hypothetical protein
MMPIQFKSANLCCSMAPVKWFLPLIAGATLLLPGCYSIRKNEKNIPVYKRKEALPAYTEKTQAVEIVDTESPKPVESSPTPSTTSSTEMNATESTATSTKTSAQPTQERIHRMVHESKMEIIASGMSAEYVEAHFKVVEMIDEETEKKVIWRYQIGEYQIEIIDLVNWNMDAQGNIQYTHNIRQEWGTTRNIETVISSAEADQAMRNCIGDYEGSVLKYTALELPGSASPWLIAKSTKPAPGGSPEDKIFLQGYINLETGACHKEIAGVIHTPLDDRK